MRKRESRRPKPENEEKDETKDDKNEARRSMAAQKE